MGLGRRHQEEDSTIAIGRLSLCLHARPPPPPPRRSRRSGGAPSLFHHVGFSVISSTVLLSGSLAAQSRPRKWSLRAPPAAKTARATNGSEGEREIGEGVRPFPRQHRGAGRLRRSATRRRGHGRRRATARPRPESAANQAWRVRAPPRAASNTGEEKREFNWVGKGAAGRQRARNIHSSIIRKPRYAGTHSWSQATTPVCLWIWCALKPEGERRG